MVLYPFRTCISLCASLCEIKVDPDTLGENTCNTTKRACIYIYEGLNSLTVIPSHSVHLSLNVANYLGT